MTGRSNADPFAELISLVNRCPRARRSPLAVSPLDGAEIAARLRLSATRLARILRQQADLGLTPSQITALATVGREGPLTLGALADTEHVTPPSMTKVVERLERSGSSSAATTRSTAGACWPP